MSLFPAFRRSRGRGRGLSAIAGPVLRPADTDYAAELAAFNTAVALRPGLVVGATSEADVAAAICVAAADGLPVAVKGAGHGVTADTGAPVLISTRRLDAVDVAVRARTARVGAGACWSAVVRAAAPHGLAPLCASSTAVGVAGYTLGGGLGVFGRRFGFAADHVRRLRLVTADGRPHEIDADRAPELFWALRGGGARGFGVVTELEFALFPVSRWYGGGLFLPGEAAAEVLHAWREWAPGLPDEAGTSVALRRLPDDPGDLALPRAAELRGRTVVHLRYAHCGTGTGARAADALLAPMRAIAAPLLDDVRERACTDTDALHREPATPAALHDAGVALRELPAEAVDALLAAAGPQVPSPLDLVELRWMGGALARPAEVPNVVAGRAAACSVYARGPVPAWTGASTAVSRVVEAVAPWSLGGALPNFAGVGPPEALWSLGDRVRLRVLRHAVDPEGMFAAERSG
jgi:FAD/FMN-containing dehydrogenase